MFRIGNRINKGLFTSMRGDWCTPYQLIAALRYEFPFTFDAAARPSDAVAASYSENGLNEGHWPGVVWCNPPYGREVSDWIRKAINSAAHGSTVVVLLPARTDTKWFHSLVIPHAEIRFLAGRLSFDDAKGRAPFPSMLAIFRPEERPLSLEEIRNVQTKDESGTGT